MAARIVLLGASNLTRGISTVLGMSRNGVGAPVTFLVAMGHGRSYGRRSRVLARSLPGILECGLWDALGAAPPGPTYALVTDIGNDIAYGVPVPTLLHWVGACLDRLAAHGAVISMSLPPLASLQRASPLTFSVCRALLFPRRPLSREAALASLHALDAGLRGKAASRGISLTELPAAWYGLDPIHPRRRHLGRAWQRLLGPWRLPASPSRPRPSPGRWLRIRVATPQQWWLLGAPRGRPQPAAHLPDGSTVGLY